MTSGVGFQEILVIAVLVLVLFGAKGLSGVMRDLGKFVGSLKKYRDEFTRELMAISEPPVDEKKIRSDQRADIRKKCLRFVKELLPADRAKQNMEITGKVAAAGLFTDAKSIFCFLSMPEEFDTKPILEQALARGKEVYVPYCLKDSNEIKAARISDLSRDLCPGAYGIPEPVEGLRNPADPLDIDLFLIPGASFDHQCTRLGRGKGYFDRFLAGIKGKRPLWGLAFSEQIYAYSIPREDHDVAMDMIITPFETIEATNGK